MSARALPPGRTWAVAVARTQGERAAGVQLRDLLRCPEAGDHLKWPGLSKMECRPTRTLSPRGQLQKGPHPAKDLKDSRAANLVHTSGEHIVIRDKPSHQASHVRKAKDLPCMDSRSSIIASGLGPSLLFELLLKQRVLFGFLFDSTKTTPCVFQPLLFTKLSVSPRWFSYLSQRYKSGDVYCSFPHLLRIGQLPAPPNPPKPGGPRPRLVLLARGTGCDGRLIGQHAALQLKVREASVHPQRLRPVGTWRRQKFGTETSTAPPFRASLPPI